MTLDDAFDAYQKYGNMASVARTGFAPSSVSAKVQRARDDEYADDFVEQTLASAVERAMSELTVPERVALNIHNSNRRAGAAVFDAPLLKELSAAQRDALVRAAKDKVQRYLSREGLL